MKNLYKAALLTALGLGSLASAQAQQSGGGSTYNQDLILGFTASGANAGGEDLEYDLGSVSSLYNGETFTLTSLLAAQDLSTSTVNWGVVGSTTSNHTTYQTEADADGAPAGVPSQAQWTSDNTAIKAIYQSSFSSAGAGNSAIISSSVPNSWNVQTLNPSLGTQLANELQGTPDDTGVTSINFYSQDDLGSDPTLLGDFSLASDGVVTFSAVPEPTTYGLIAGGGLLVLSLRNRFRNQQA